MKELSSALFRVGLAPTLFGARQITTLLSPRGEQPAEHTVNVLNSVASTLVDGCDEPLQDTFDVAQKVEREMVETALNAFAIGNPADAGANGAIPGIVRQALNRMGQIMEGFADTNSTGRTSDESSGKSRGGPVPPRGDEPPEPGPFWSHGD
jgi:hypothetical protein